mmetsp:Transcript_7571/g.13191  ORF Transcript_7571/g.13191 Transcript_7571/m.13191 type:complete len:224 (+) Transcript_7571:125-796(+)
MLTRRVSVVCGRRAGELLLPAMFGSGCLATSVGARQQVSTMRFLSSVSSAAANTSARRRRHRYKQQHRRCESAAILSALPALSLVVGRVARAQRRHAEQHVAAALRLRRGTAKSVVGAQFDGGAVGRHRANGVASRTHRRTTGRAAEERARQVDVCARRHRHAAQNTAQTVVDSTRHTGAGVISGEQRRRTVLARRPLPPRRAACGTRRHCAARCCASSIRTD